MHMRINQRTLVTLLFPLLAITQLRGQSSDPTPKPKQAIAVVAGKSIYEDDLAPLVQGQLRPLLQREYDIKSKALDDLVNKKVLEAEAAKKGVTADKLLEQEVDAKVADPADAEVEAFYEGQKQRSNSPFEEIKAQLRQSLKQARAQQARQEFMKRLREQSDVSVLLQPPKAEVGYDKNRVRGSAQAPVVIVEFADFQCPYCRQVEPTITSLLDKHKGRVSLAYRDFPLFSIHPFALGAAEAGRCAGEQGKFWEYHDLLFAHPDKLERPGLLEEARSLNLDEKQFESCLSSEKYKTQIDADVQDASRAGVNGTPSFFINGVFVDGAKPEAEFEKIIQEELTASKHGPSARITIT